MLSKTGLAVHGSHYFYFSKKRKLTHPHMGDVLLTTRLEIRRCLFHCTGSVEMPPCAGCEEKLAATQVRPERARQGSRACALRQEAESRSITEYCQFIRVKSQRRSVFFLSSLSFWTSKKKGTRPSGTKKIKFLIMDSRLRGNDENKIGKAKN